MFSTIVPLRSSSGSKNQRANKTTTYNVPKWDLQAYLCTTYTTIWITRQNEWQHQSVLILEYINCRRNFNYVFGFQVNDNDIFKKEFQFDEEKKTSHIISTLTPASHRRSATQRGSDASYQDSFKWVTSANFFLSVESIPVASATRWEVPLTSFQQFWHHEEEEKNIFQKRRYHKGT